MSRTGRRVTAAVAAAVGALCVLAWAAPPAAHVRGPQPLTSAVSPVSDAADSLSAPAGAALTRLAALVEASSAFKSVRHAAVSTPRPGTAARVLLALVVAGAASTLWVSTGRVRRPPGPRPRHTPDARPSPRAPPAPVLV